MILYMAIFEGGDRMAKVNHSYMKETTFLSPIGLQCKPLSDSKRDFVLSELKVIRQTLNNSIEDKKATQKSR